MASSPDSGTAWHGRTAQARGSAPIGEVHGLQHRFTMTRIQAAWLFSLTFAGLETGCSSAHTEPASAGDSGAASTTDAAASGAASTTDAAACIIVPADYDQSCSSDSDCTWVLPGGNTCEACEASYLFTCGQAPINVGAAAAYTAALTKALPAPPGIHFAVTACGMGVSCPTAEVIACVHGQCAIVQGDAGF
jgi:hypothetical protein